MSTAVTGGPDGTVQEGGARYHDYGFAPLGIATVADALAGLKMALWRERLSDMG